MNITFNSVRNATVNVTSETDKYSLSAYVAVKQQDGAVGNIDGGSVSSDGKRLATFSTYRNEQLSLAFDGAATEDFSGILEAVKEFVAAVREQAGGISVNVENKEE
jgi:hypothetical protein